MWRLNTIRLEDRGGRRSGRDRRSFFAPSRVLERRTGQDRRMHLDRRIGKEDLVIIFKPKRSTDGPIEFSRAARDLIEWVLVYLLLWGAIILSIDYIFERIITSNGSLK